MIKLHQEPAIGRLASLPSIEYQLLQIITPLTTRQAATPSAAVLELYEQLRESSTFGTAWRFPKCSEIGRKQGKDTVVKLLAITLADLSQIAQPDCRLLPIQITGLAEELAHQFPYESYREFVVAFKEVRQRVSRWRRPLSRRRIIQLLHTHFERRAEYLERFHGSYSEKNPAYSQRA